MKIFLASSNELNREREYLASLVFYLGRLLHDMGIGQRVELVKWEYLDSPMGPLRKQEEYNLELATCDMVFVLFWRRFGEYTEEEFRNALEGMRNRQRPRKVVVMFKKGGEAVEPGLVSFRESLIVEAGLEVMEFSSDDELSQKVMSTIIRHLEEK